jgi:hypothetical protein
MKEKTKKIKVTKAIKAPKPAKSPAPLKAVKVAKEKNVVAVKPARTSGRKAIVEGEPTITVSLRMTEKQREKMGLLGGAIFVRNCIDLAKLSDNLKPKPKAKRKASQEVRV